MKIKLPKIKCAKCGWEWVPRKTDVRMCPKCKTAYFDDPERYEKLSGFTGHMGE